MSTYKEAIEKIDRKQLEKITCFLFNVLAFYGDPETWFATVLIPDRPAGDINEDYSDCAKYDLGFKPGRRARLALLMIQRALKEALNE